MSNLRQVTPYNDHFNFNYSTPEKFYFQGGYNETVQGWIFKPIDFDATKNYSVALLIHVGPESSWASGWSYGWNPQLYTSRGFAVVMVNPHGSEGQGYKFKEAVRNDWGGVPYLDIMAGLDYALDNNKWMNKDKICALGASYGGYMVNWIQGQTDRFKCLVTHDGAFDTLAKAYSTDELFFPFAEHCPLNRTQCFPWDKNYRELFTKFSPEEYVRNWKTPHLIIQGSKDYRIPVSEALSAFTALQVKGIPSKLLHFTQENHWVLRTENNIKWYNEVLEWLDQYIGTTG